MYGTVPRRSLPLLEEGGPLAVVWWLFYSCDVLILATPQPTLSTAPQGEPFIYLRLKQRQINNEFNSKLWASLIKRSDFLNFLTLKEDFTSGTKHQANFFTTPHTVHYALLRTHRYTHCTVVMLYIINAS